MLGALSRSAALRARVRGFTMIELMVTLAIAAVLLALAAPSMYSMVQRKRTAGAAESLRTDLRDAQRMALSIAPDMAVHFAHDATSSCYLVYSQTNGPGMSECSCRATPACTSINTKVVKLAAQTPVDGVRYVASTKGNPLPEAIVVFRRQIGTLKPGIDYVTDLSVSVEGAGRGGQLKLLLEPSGRTRLCSVGGEHAGYPTCA